MAQQAQLYDLPGSRKFPQVEPGAAFWLRAGVPRAVTLEEVRREVDHLVPDFVPGKDDFELLRELEGARFDPEAFRRKEQLSRFLSDRRYILNVPRSPTPTPVYPPPGSVYNRRENIAEPFLKTGAELARLFEAETPGLWHRHVLNVLLDPTVKNGLGQKLSPPRQALLWAVLDVATSSALQAAWYYKWFSLDGGQVSYRPRPWEVDQTFTVLYDYMLRYEGGDIVNGPLRDDPQPSPGTPRHPAYPSGHSTYSAAASVVLGCLLPGYRASFNRLANNIGRARIWAGVHWLQDHLIGQTIGRGVARLVIEQLNRSGIEVMPVPMPAVPDQQDLKKMEDDFYRRQREGANFCSRRGFTGDLGGGGDEEAEHWVMNPCPVFVDKSGDEVPMPPADDEGELDIDSLPDKAPPAD